jgi:hypothetical protein
VNFYNYQSLDSLGAAPTGTITLSDQLGSSTTKTTLATLPVTGTAGSSTAMATGGATYTTTTLGAGTHVFYATYSGDANYSANQNIPDTFVNINGATAAMTMAPASNPAKNDKPLPVTITLAQSGTYPSPTGTVTLIAYNGSDPIFNSTAVSLVSGTAVVTIPANTLPITNIDLYSIYSGDKDYNSNTAIAHIQVISSGTVAPNVTITPPSGVQSTSPISIPVTVTGPGGSATPTGSVTLSVGGSFWGTQTLVNGSTSFMVSYLQGGANSLTVSYTGDSTYAGGTASGVVKVIAFSLISFNPNSQQIAVNQPLTFTVSVGTNTGNPIPAATGTIALVSGSYMSGPSALSAGSAAFTIPANSLAQGFDTITATYSGDANYAPSNNDEYVSVSAAIPPGINLSGTNLFMAPGSTTGNTSTITLSPIAGFTGAVTLSASLASSPAGAVNPPTLSFGATSPVTITGAGSQTATLTVSTSAPTSASITLPPAPGARWRRGAIALACMALFGLGAIRRRGRNALIMLVLLVGLVGSAVSCGGGGGSGSSGGTGSTGNSKPGTTPGVYTITVTATSGTINATTTVNLTLN